MMLDLKGLLAVMWTLWGVNFISTCCRGVLRWRVQGKYVLEDYFAVLGFVMLTALTAVITTAAPHFFLVQEYLKSAITDPTKMPDIEPSEIVERTTFALKLMFAQMLLFWSTVWAGKFSLLVFFRRMVLGLPKYLKLFWVVFALVLITYLGCMVSNFMTCKPLSKYWSETGCSDPENVKRADESIRFATGADVAADFLIMLLPLKLLWNLQISRRQKIGLACMFCLGAIVIAFAFVRLHNVTKATSAQSFDPSKVANGPLILAFWSQLEGAVAVLVSNLPAFRSLLRTGGTTTRPSKPYAGTSYPSRSTGTDHGTKLQPVTRESSEQHIRNYSLEMQSLCSDPSSYNSHGGSRDNGNSGTGIVRTTEFEIRSTRRSQDEENGIRRPARPFVPDL